MKILSTVFTGSDLEWKIKVSPRKNLINKNEYVPTFNVWTPDDGSGFTALIYNPVISLSPTPTRKSPNDKRNCPLIPMDKIYLFVNMLEQVYKDLSTPKMFVRSPEGQLIADKNLTNKARRKIKLYSQDLVVIPSVVYGYNEETYGIHLYHGGEFTGTMTHKDLRMFCEIMMHLDIQVYSLLLNMVEQNIELNNKMDKLTCDVSDIKNLLNVFIKSQQMGQPRQNEEVKSPSVDAGFGWTNLPPRGGII